MKNCSDSFGKILDDDLVFPDWSGLDDSTARLSLKAALDLPELYRSWFPGLVSNLSVMDREKADVEFVL